MILPVLTGFAYQIYSTTEGFFCTLLLQVKPFAKASIKEDKGRRRMPRLAKSIF